jgi:hypothetical protein
MPKGLPFGFRGHNLIFRMAEKDDPSKDYPTKLAPPVDLTNPPTCTLAEALRQIARTNPLSSRGQARLELAEKHERAMAKKKNKKV